MNESVIDFFRRRESAERNAAELATCDAARRAHEEMATAYSERLRSEGLDRAGQLVGDNLIEVGTRRKASA